MKFNNKVNDFLNETTQTRSFSWDNSAGTKLWYKITAPWELHREDGPAVEYKDGRTEWHINGIKLSLKEIEEQKQKIALDKRIKSTIIGDLWDVL